MIVSWLLHTFWRLEVQMQVDAAAQVMDPLEMPRGPITRARAKKFKEALLNLIKTHFLEVFEEGEMKEGTGYTTYACTTIVVHEDWSWRGLCSVVYFVKYCLNRIRIMISNCFSFLIYLDFLIDLGFLIRYPTWFGFLKCFRFPNGFWFF